MTTILVDHDMEGQAALLWSTLVAGGWSELTPVRMVRFADVGLSVTSSDREVWRLAQSQRMLLLTNNRNMRGRDALGRVIREESTPDSLPVLTIGNRARINEPGYRAACAERLVEIGLYIERYLGAGRVFIP